MKNIKKLILKSFQTKVTLAFIFSLLVGAGVGNLLLYEYSLRIQFNQVRQQLLAVAKTAALSIDVDSLLRVPLKQEGVNSQEYQQISEQLNRIKKINPALKYIYIMTKTETPGIWQFVVDPDPQVPNPKGATAFPGDIYDVSRFPQMLQSFERPMVDKKMNSDEWGTTLSGYAPIRDAVNNTVAVLGVDINADKLYAMRRAVRLRALLVLLGGLTLSIFLGFMVSRRVIKPIGKLVEGTRRIAAGDLDFKVEIDGEDEIAELSDSFNNMASSLSQSRKDLQDYFYRVVQAMVRSLEAKDHYTRGHSDRVSEYAALIAKEMGFASEKIDMLTKAAQLHDIGKLGIHEAILNKTGTLSSEEWDLIHSHPAVGEEILKPILLDREMLEVAKSHHERFDGKGYPQGLIGEKVNIFAQIVSVADAYDAMTSSRSYRPALARQEALSRIKEGSGTQFNPKVVEAFLKAMG